MMKCFLFVICALAPFACGNSILDDDRFKLLMRFLNDAISKMQFSNEFAINISDYLNQYDYPFESHEVETDDNYAITLHRIPSVNNEPDNAKSPAALFVPCLLCSSIDWVSQGPNKSLALLMFDLGYDIWLLNTRGSRYSMKHNTLNVSEAAFWDFSFHDKSYDIESSIDFILGMTQLQKMILIAHSEGTSSSMVLLSTKPEYNDKLKLAVFMSPIAYMGGVNSHLPVLMAKYMSEIKVPGVALNLLNIHALPYSEGFSNAVTFICSIDGFTEICVDLLGFLCGSDSKQADLVSIHIAAESDKPAGGSPKEFFHYGQEMLTGTFRHFDYGPVENLIRYETIEPPAYNVSQIIVPLAAFYAKNDLLASVSDVENLLDQIPNKVDTYLIEYELFNHLDFIIAKDVKGLLYDRVLILIEKYKSL